MDTSYKTTNHSSFPLQNFLASTLSWTFPPFFSFPSDQTVLRKTKKEMAVAARGKATELQIPKKWRDRSECSPERTIVWTEPKANKTSEKRSVPVVYYLSRNGQLEHPHFIEVPLSSPEGLYLRGKIQTQLCKKLFFFFFLNYLFVVWLPRKLMQRFFCFLVSWSSLLFFRLL